MPTLRILRQWVNIRKAVFGDTMCSEYSTELYEEMLEWEREQERIQKLAKAKKETQAPVITVKVAKKN